MSILMNENPLVVNTELAKKIGLNEAIVLQQIHYWAEINRKAKRNYKEGNYWTFNSLPKWQEQFPFWSLSTIKRIIKSLEDRKLLITGNYNKKGFDRTKWYRINHEVLESTINSPSCQNDPTIGSKWTDATVQNDPTNTRDYTENISEINYIHLLQAKDDYASLYLFIYKKYFNKEHMRITKKQYETIMSSLTEIKSDIDLDEWEEKVIEHFDKLPARNNGNILSFLKASYRYFKVRTEQNGFF